MKKDLYVVKSCQYFISNRLSLCVYHDLYGMCSLRLVLLFVNGILTQFVALKSPQFNSGSACLRFFGRTKLYVI
jgi:hypothetical protein